MGKNWDESDCDILPIQIHMSQTTKQGRAFETTKEPAVDRRDW